MVSCSSATLEIAAAAARSTSHDRSKLARRRIDSPMDEERTPSPPAIASASSIHCDDREEDEDEELEELEQQVIDPTAPIHERVEEAEVIYQIPATPPRAVLLIAHPGCGSPADFWPPHPRCDRCKGLPEHSSIVRAAISRGYAAVAIKSVKDYWQTWPLEVSHDAFAVELALESWRRRHGLESLPLVALGAASGGSFVSALALKIEFAALVVMISHGVSRAFQRATNRYPPTIFVHMPKDSLTAAKIQREIHVLQRKGIPTEELPCLDFAISSAFFADNLPRLGSHASSKLFAALVIHGVINGGGFVTSAMQASEIHELLARADIFGYHSDNQRQTLVESINSLIRVAEARHAVTGRKNSEIFEWLEQHIIRRHL